MFEGRKEEPADTLKAIYFFGKIMNKNIVKRFFHILNKFLKS